MEKVKDILNHVLYFMGFYFLYYFIMLIGNAAGSNIVYVPITFMEIILIIVLFREFVLKKYEIVILVAVLFIQLILGNSLLVSYITIAAMMLYLFTKFEMFLRYKVGIGIIAIAIFGGVFILNIALVPYALLLLILVIDLYLQSQNRDNSSGLIVFMYVVHFVILFILGSMFSGSGLPNEYRVPIYQDQFLVTLLLVSFSVDLIRENEKRKKVNNEFM